MIPLTISIAEASRSLGLGKTTVQALIASGALRAVKIGRRTLIPIASLQQLIGSADGQVGPVPSPDEPVQA